jgi:hypothetical protein
MQKEKIDVYLGSRLRTLSWTLDAFLPWRGFVVIPAEGMPAAFTFVIDAARVADDTWIEEDRVFGFAPMGGQDQIELIADFIKDNLTGGKGRVGVESGMSNYLPEAGSRTTSTSASSRPSPAPRSSTHTTSSTAFRWSRTRAR